MVRHSAVGVPSDPRNNLNNYATSLLQDRSASLIRIFMTFITVLLIRAESIDKDQHKYRRTVKYCLYVVSLSEIFAYGLQLYGLPLWQQVVRKLGVELVYMVLNCSVVYHMNGFLGYNLTTLNRIFYG